jgi:acetoacetyl-CoA reductase
MARTALVTGGTRGIGEAVSLALKEAGYTVAASYAGNDEAANAFKEANGIQVFKFDVGDFAACQDAVAKIEAETGAIDVLVNNAGITRDAPLHRMTPEQWNDVIRTNLDSCFNLSRCVLDGMRERGYGRIVNISSINGQKGQFGQTNYAAAKAGMIGFTKALALETASKGITVNAIAPGRGRALRRLPRLRGCRLHHRLDADRERRPVHGLGPRALYRHSGAGVSRNPESIYRTVPSTGVCPSRHGFRITPAAFPE